MAIGVFRQQDGWLQRCDPRAKLVAAVLFLGAVVLASGGGAVALVTGAALLLWWGSGQGPRQALALLKPLMPLVAFIFLVNGICTYVALAEVLGAPAALVSAVGGALFVVLKLVDALLGAATVMITTAPVRLTAAFRWFMGPLARFGVNVDEAAFSLTMVLRFVPLLGEEAVRIKAAQTSRGASFDCGGVIARVQQWVPVITPLFVGALRRCDNVAYAVASRAFFAPVKHTSLVRLKAGIRDAALVLLAFLLVAAILLAKQLS